MAELILYGATGYTGRLIAERAAGQGLRPLLAGRDADKLRPMAREASLEWRAFALDDPARVRVGLADAQVVLNAAGPFSRTARPIADACLKAGAHYLDITGDIDVFEALAARDEEARGAGAMLLPGAGFDVVPSDCLAAHLKARMPEAVRLLLSIGGLGEVSRGTARTMAEVAGRGTRVRRSGRIVELDTPPAGTADFGSGPRRTVAVSWGDVATAWRSTRIPDIEVRFEATPPLEKAVRAPLPLRKLLGTRPAQWLINRAIDRMPPGPDAEQRRSGRAVLIGEAWDGEGRRIESRLVTPEGYRLTAMTAVEIARRVLAGDSRPGFQTPATAFGADFVLCFEGVERRDTA